MTEQPIDPVRGGSCPSRARVDEFPGSATRVRFAPHVSTGKDIDASRWCPAHICDHCRALFVPDPGEGEPDTTAGPPTETPEQGGAHRIDMGEVHRTAFPLICADSGDPMDEDRYLVLGDGDEPPEGHTLRRCRKALATEVITVDADDMAERLDEELAGDGPVTPGGDVFARWDDEIVSTKPGAQEALEKWANEWLEIRAWVAGPAAHLKGETDGD
jgi:hypothetical protein